MIYANEKNRLWNLCQVSIRMIKELAKQIKNEKLVNENFVQEWIDKLYNIVQEYDIATEDLESPEDYLKAKTKQMVEDISELWKQLEPYRNEQWVLDCTDELNKVSVTY